MVAISVRNKIMRKFANFVRLYFPHIFQPNFGILLLLKGSFRECSFLGRDLSRTKISLKGKLSIVLVEVVSFASLKEVYHCGRGLPIVEFGGGEELWMLSWLKNAFMVSFATQQSIYH